MHHRVCTLVSMTPDRIQGVVSNEEEWDHLINKQHRNLGVLQRKERSFSKKLGTNFWNRQRISILYVGGDINFEQKHMCSQGILIQQEMYISTCKIWTPKNITAAARLQDYIYKTLVVSCLAACSTIQRQDIYCKLAAQQRVKVFKMTCLRKFLSINQWDRMKNGNGIKQLN